MQNSLTRMFRLAGRLEPNLKRAACSSRFILKQCNEKTDELLINFPFIQTNFQISKRSNKRIFSTSCAYFKENQDTQTLEKMNEESIKNDEIPQKKLTQAQRLRKVFAEYGTTAVVFHTCISLTSLGICYAAVSSGIDVPGILQKVGFSEDVTSSTVASGASTFVIAYACHKVFVPVRMFLTITCTPLIVRRLRTLGILKVPVK